MKNRIKIERAIHDLTQQQIADAVGTSRQTINAIEKAKYIPSTLLALKIAHTFGRTVDEVFELEENE